MRMIDIVAFAVQTTLAAMLGARDAQQGKV